MRYVRQELLALRYWWKIPTTSGFHSARFSGSHSEIKPLSEHLEKPQTNWDFKTLERMSCWAA